MKLTITFLARYDKKKDGTALIGSNGRPYTSLRIKSSEYGDKYISGFDGPQTQDWKVGDVIEADVEQKGEYLNFSVPKIQKSDDILLQKIYQEVYAARQEIVMVRQLLQKSGTLPTVDYPEDIGDTPF